MECMPARRFLPYACLIALFAVAAHAGTNRWTLNGPDAGTTTRFAYDSLNPSIVYARAEAGIFRSTDGGQHWASVRASLGILPQHVEVAYSDPQKVYVSTLFGLLKSNDRGITWQTVHPFGSYTVAVSRTNANVVYSVSTGGPFRSTDGGQTFDPVGSGLPPSAASASALAVDPQNPDIVYAAYSTNAGVYKSVDGGAHWSASSSGLPQAVLLALVIDPANGTLYVCGYPGVFKSTDGGASWTSISANLTICVSMAIAPGTLVVGTAQGAFKTTNGGASWSPRLGLGSGMVSGITVDPSNTSNILGSTFTTLRSTDGGTTFNAVFGITAQLTQTIAADPKKGATVYTGGPAGLFKSTNAGETWSLLTTDGATSVAVDPFDSSTVYASFGNVKLSNDGGVTWQSFSTGLPPGTSVTLVPDPSTPGVLYGMGGGTIYKKAGSGPWTPAATGLPSGFGSLLKIDPSRGATLFTAIGTSVYKSVDAAASWSAANGGLSGVAIGGLAVDPFDSSHLLAWANSSGYESKDGGANWLPFSGQAHRQAISFAFDPTVPGRVYEDSDDSVDRSSDGGNTWQLANTGLPRSHDSGLVIASNGLSLYTGGVRGGVWSMHFGRSRAVGH